MTRAPSRAKRSAVARPMPVVPVTKAILPPTLPILPLPVSKSATTLHRRRHSRKGAARLTIVPAEVDPHAIFRKDGAARSGTSAAARGESPEPSSRRIAPAGRGNQWPRHAVLDNASFTDTSMLLVPDPDSGFLPSQRISRMKFGAQITATGTRFRLWAPRAGAVALKLERDGERRPMTPLRNGWYELHVDGVGHGDLYRYVLEDGTEVPDPASRFQPHDVLGPSEVIDPRRFPWTDVGWVGRPWEGTVLYELHVGTFTPEGTFAAAIGKLDPLVELGVDFVE
jgi:hypothetical protein